MLFFLIFYSVKSTNSLITIMVGTDTDFEWTNMKWDDTDYKYLIHR